MFLYSRENVSTRFQVTVLVAQEIVPNLGKASYIQSSPHDLRRFFSKEAIRVNGAGKVLMIGRIQSSG
jgi:hypothetical protein